MEGNISVCVVCVLCLLLLEQYRYSSLKIPGALNIHEPANLKAMK